METCVLIPPEFALGYSKDAKFSVLSTRSLKPGILFHPFQGNIRIDKLAAPLYIDEDDVSLIVLLWVKVKKIVIL